MSCKTYINGCMIGYFWDYGDFVSVHERGPTNKYKTKLSFKKFKYCPDCGRRVK